MSEPFEWLPSHCAECGALLRGGATRHAETCWWWKFSYICSQEDPELFEAARTIREFAAGKEEPHD